MHTNIPYALMLLSTYTATYTYKPYSIHRYIYTLLLMYHYLSIYIRTIYYNAYYIL